MPNLRLSEQDADDLISFLHRENAKLVEAPAPAAAARAQALKLEPHGEEPAPSASQTRVIALMASATAGVSNHVPGRRQCLGHPSRPCRKRVYARLRRAVAGHLGMRPSQGSALRYPFFGDQR
jgi:hypothetical protein